MLSSALNTEADVAGEVLARLEAACQHFFEALRSERRALRARKPDLLLEAVQRKQEAARQLSDAQDRAAGLSASAGLEESMSGFVALALRSFESNKSLLKRLNAMIDLLGQCARSNEIAREIVESRLAATDEALRILLQNSSEAVPYYGREGNQPRRGKGASRGAA